MSFKKLISEIAKNQISNKSAFLTETINIQQCSGNLITTNGSNITMSTNRLIKIGGSVVIIVDDRGRKFAIGENCK
jgi:hypothetical protein